MSDIKSRFVAAVILSRPVITGISLITLALMFFGCHELARITAIVVVGVIVFRFATMFLFFDKAKLHFNRDHAEWVVVGKKLCKPLDTLLPPPYFTMVEPLVLKMVWSLIISAEIIGSAIFIVLFLWLGVF